MSLEHNKVFTGISIPLTTQRAASEGAIELTDEDISGLEGVKPLYRAIRAALGEGLGKPILVGADIRMALSTPKGELPLPFCSAQIAANLQLTADQLKANARREQPLKHSKVLSHAPIGKVLEALSNAHRRFGTKLVVCTEAGDVEAPVLDASDFIEPDHTDANRQSGRFKITGLFRDEQSCLHGLLLTGNRLLVSLPRDDERWTWSAIRNALDAPTFLLGSIVRTGTSGDWKVEDGARLEFQEQIAGL